MYLIATTGHALLRYYAVPILGDHVEFSDSELQKKAMDDYLVQRSYLREKEKSQQ